MGEDGKGPTLQELHERNRPPESKPIAVRLPKPLLADLDDIWEAEGFETRSAFVRSVLQRVAEEPAAFSFESGNWERYD